MARSAKPLEILNRVETCVVDVKDTVTLQLTDYLLIDQSVNDTEISIILINIDSHTNEEKLSDDFSISLRSKYEFDNGIWKYFLILDSFALNNTTVDKFNRYKINVTVGYAENMIKDQEGVRVKPNESNTRQLDFQLRVIDVENLKGAAHCLINNRELSYNPHMQTGVFMNYKTGLPLSLRYSLECLSPNPDNTPPLALPSYPIIDSVEDFSMNGIVRRNSKLEMAGGYLVEINRELGYIKFFEFNSTSRWKLIKGFAILPYYNVAWVSPVGDEGILLFCCHNKKKMIYYYELKDNIAYSDSTSVDKWYRECMYSQSGRYFACLYSDKLDLLTNNRKNVSKAEILHVELDLIHLYKVDTNPLILTDMIEIDQSMAIDMYKRRTNDINANMKITFKSLSPCPSIPTTVVAVSLVNMTRCAIEGQMPCENTESELSLNTIHINKGNDTLELLNWHHIQDLLTETNLDFDILLCAFKSSMFIYNKLSNQIYTEVIDFNRQYYPTEFTKGRDVIDYRCMNDLGYMALLTRSIHDTSLVVFSGNDIYSASGRIFAVVSVDKTHDTFFFGKKNKELSFFTKRSDDSIVDVFKQNVQYPSFDLVTYDPGNYTCVMTISDDIDEDSSINSTFTVEVKKWPTLTVNPHSSEPMVITQPGLYNLESHYDFDGAFFSAQMIYDEDSTCKEKDSIVLLPRFQPIRAFGNKFSGSDYREIAILNEKFFFAMCENKVDALYLNDDAPNTYEEFEKDIGTTYYNIATLYLNGDRVVASEMLTKQAQHTEVEFYYTVAIIIEKSTDDDKSDQLSLLLIRFDKLNRVVEKQKYDLGINIEKECNIEQVKALSFDLNLGSIKHKDFLDYKLYVSFLQKNKTELVLTSTEIQVPWKHIGKDGQAMKFGVVFKTYITDKYNMYNMRSYHFQVKQYFLKAHEADIFTLELLSNNELFVLTYFASKSESVWGYSSLQLGNFSDTASSFDCCPGYKNCLVTFEGGKLVKVGFGKDPTSNSYRFLSFESKASIPSKYPPTSILLGRDFVIFYNFEYEDYIMVYNKTDLNHLFVSFKKEYGIDQVIRLIHGSSDGLIPDMLVMSYGKELGQVYIFRPMAVKINSVNTYDDDPDESDMSKKIKGVSLIFNRFSGADMNETYANSLTLPMPIVINKPKQPSIKIRVWTLMIILSLLTIMLVYYCFWYEAQLNRQNYEQAYGQARSSDWKITAGRRSESEQTI